MPLPSPDLDDRTFEQLVNEAVQRVRRTCPEWTDLSPGDPGMTLLELFAHLTEVMLYRLNRLPQKAYVEFLRLIGVRIQPPAAASVTLLFTRSSGSDAAIEIPRSTRVAAGQPSAEGDVAVFVTSREAVLAPGEVEAAVRAYHCDMVAGELAGIGTGINGAAIGAQVRIHLGEKTLTRQVEAGTGEGNQNDLTLHFGLGNYVGQVDLEITAPGGTTGTVTGISVDRQADYMLSITGGSLVITPVLPTSCGDVGTVYRLTDINEDCIVNLEDLALFASEWQTCTHPADTACD